MKKVLRSLVLSLVALGCGTPAVAPVDGGSDAASAADAGGTDTIVVHTFEVDGTSLAGAVVALDLPSGSRVELTSGADGLARFTGLRFSDGMFDVIAWAPGHAAFAHVAMTGADYTSRTNAGELQIGLRPLTTPRVALTGHIAGVAPTELVFVTTDSTPLFYEAAGPAYATQVGANTPFRVVAASLAYVPGAGRDYTQTFHRWAVTPMQPASATAVVIDIDLTADAATPHTTTGSFSVPAHAAGSFFANAGATVGIYDDVAGMGTLGMASSIAIAADGLSVDYTAEYVLPPGVTRPSLNLSMSVNNTYTSASIVGMPVDGPQAFTFLDPPDVVGSAGGIPHALDPIVVRNPQPTALLQSIVTSDDRPRFVVVAPVGARAISYPALPTGADRAVLLDGTLGRHISFCVLDGPGLRNRCTLASSVGEIADP